MINIKLTSVGGTERNIAVESKNDAFLYVRELPNRLAEGTRLRIDSDIVGLNGWISGTAKK